MDSMEQQKPQQTQRLQIYPNSNNGVTPFWRGTLSYNALACKLSAQKSFFLGILFIGFYFAKKYEREAKRYWDVFYKCHKDKGDYFSGEGKKVILEVGCGAENTIFPVIASYPDAFVYACDFSPRAIELVKTHEDFKESCVRAFVSDLTVDDLCKEILPSSVDIVTMIFMLSAVSPEKMPLVLQNVRKIIKPNGYVLFRDYATEDLAQERFSGKDQKFSDNFYVRGDGTRAYYFSNEFLTNLFRENGFVFSLSGQSCNVTLVLRWVQAVFRFTEDLNSSSSNEAEGNRSGSSEAKQNSSNGSLNDSAIDLSEGVAFDMLLLKDIIEIKLRGWNFKIRVLLKQYQHTCKSTGLMLWESARLMASLGSGCGGICSMIAAKHADLVAATDGNALALDLLAKNVSSNLEPPLLTKLITKKLEWGNNDHIEAIKEGNKIGFDVIIGTDVTYIPEAILPLFASARELITSGASNKHGNVLALILCHIFRRVDEPSLLSAASQFGFRLVDKWSAGVPNKSSQGIISKWFSDNSLMNDLPSTALNILLFRLE
ncbi:hypothetical protein AAHE18_20G098200 [Arachis hypogaea]